MIRQATLDDSAQVLDLMFAIEDESPIYNIYNIIYNKVLYIINKSIVDKDKYISVKENDQGQIVGCFMGYVSAPWYTDEKMAYDTLFYILPEFRGQSLARDMVKGFVSWSKEMGVKGVVVGETMGINNNAVKLYRSEGFSDFGSSLVRWF